MSMNRDRLRQFVLVLGLLVSVGAALWVRSQQHVEETSVVTAVTRENIKSASTNSGESQRLALERLNQRTPEATDIDPFRAKSWYVPLPEPPPAPPPKPTAPPLPFQYSGKSEDAEGGNMMVYLARGNESFAVKVGEKFAGVYQFEGIEKGNLVILYLPLSVKQRLPIGMIE